MHLFTRFILRFLARERLRAAATVLGVSLGVAVVVAIRLANASSLRGFETALDTMAGKTSVEVIGPALGIDETRLVEVGWLREYGVVSPVIEGDALARVGPAPSASPVPPAPPVSSPPSRTPGEPAAPDPASPAPSAPPSSPRLQARPPEGSPEAGLTTPAPAASQPARPARSEMVRVLGIDILRDRSIRDYQVAGLEAADPLAVLSLLTDPHSIIVTEKFATRHGLTTGAPLVLVTVDRSREYTIRGILRNEGPARVVDGNLVLMDIAAAQWAFDRLGRIDRLDVRLTDPATIDRAEAEIASRMPEGLSVQRPSRRGQQVEKMLASFHLNLTALSFVALLVGLFLVYNTVSTSVIVRREEVGTLRALGVSGAHILALFLGEAALLGAAGCLLGLGLGRLLAEGAVSLTSATVSALYVASASDPPSLSWGDAAVAFVVGVPLSLVAAALPAVEASRVPPMAAIRGADRVEARFGVRARQFVPPIALLGLGAWLATLPAVDGTPIAGFASAFALVFGAAAFVPLVLFALGRVGRPWLERLFGVEGLLANANLAGSIPRLSVSVAALAVALSMMVAIAIMIGSFRETVVHWVGQTLVADLFIGPSTRSAGARQATVSPEVERIVTEHPDVAAVDRFRNVTIPYADTQVALLAGDFAVMLERGNLLFRAPADGRAAMRGAIGRDEVIVSDAFAMRHGKGVGDRVSLPTPRGSASFAIAAIYYDYSTDRGVISMDGTTLSRHFGEWRPTGLTTYLKPGVDADAARARLLDAVGEGHDIFIYTNRSLRAEVMRVFDATFAITYALEAIAIVVAVMGVAGTLLTLILERRREIAMLRLVGAERRQVRRMVVLEAVMLGGVSQGVGLGVGWLLSLVLIYVINVQSFGWTIQFHLPWSFLSQMSVAIVVFTALAGLYPAHLASRMNLAGEVVEE